MGDRRAPSHSCPLQTQIGGGVLAGILATVAYQKYGGDVQHNVSKTQGKVRALRCCCLLSAALALCAGWPWPAAHTLEKPH